MKKYEQPTVMDVGDALEKVQNQGVIYKTSGGSDNLCGFYCFNEVDD